MSNLNNFSLKIKSNLEINFTGGQLSSDSGLLTYHTFDNIIGLSNLIKSNLSRSSNNYHAIPDVIIQNMYKHLAGYHTDDASDELMTDPVFKEIMGKKLASQPTVSRRINEMNLDDIKVLNKINEELIFKGYSIEEPEHFIFDIDSTNNKTYGKQFGSSFNYHYSCNGYHPLMLFDGMTGDLIKTELRSGNVYTSRNVVRFLGPAIKQYKKKFPDKYILVRADSGFALPALYDLVEAHDANYVIRLKANAKLGEKINDKYDCFNDDYTKHHVFYGEFEYRADSWAKARRVVYKLERKVGELHPQSTFIVTNMETSPSMVIKTYSKRGNMENFIKEIKNDFGFDTLSHHSFNANASRMMIIALAYNLNNLMRRLIIPTHQNHRQMCTLRTLIIKVAGKYIRTGRKQIIKMSSSFPYKDLMVKTYLNINQLRLSTA